MRTIRSETTKRREDEVLEAYEFLRKNLRLVEVDAGTPAFRLVVAKSEPGRARTFYLDEISALRACRRALRTGASEAVVVESVAPAGTTVLLDAHPLRRLYDPPAPPLDASGRPAWFGAYREDDPSEPEPPEFDLDLWNRRLWEDLAYRRRRRGPSVESDRVVEHLGLERGSLGLGSFVSRVAGFLSRHGAFLAAKGAVVPDGLFFVDDLGNGCVLYSSNTSEWTTSSRRLVRLADEEEEEEDGNASGRIYDVRVLREHRERDPAAGGGWVAWDEKAASTVEPWNAAADVRPRPDGDPLFASLARWRELMNADARELVSELLDASEPVEGDAMESE